jgi:putative hydrolase of the HAD superfamily
MPLGAVFLDLGNTLLRERPARAAIYAGEAGREGLAVTVDEMSACMARAHAALPRELAGAFRYSDPWFRAFHRRIFVDELGLDSARLEPLSARLFGRFDDVRTFTLYPGAHELLATVRRHGLKLGLISNWSERLKPLLQALDLASSFDFVLGSAEARMEKPEPAIFQAALRRAGVAGERCLHAGDDVERDARGALGAGIPAVLVDHAGRLEPAERALCPVVASLGELQDFVLERAA